MKKSTKESFKQKILRTIGTPEFIVRDQPEICMIGYECISIENYKSLLQYSDEMLIIRLIKGRLSIEGKGLMVKNIEEGKICVEGCIRKMCFEDSN